MRRISLAALSLLLSVTAICRGGGYYFAGGAVTDTPFVTSASLGILSAIDGFYGMKITVAGSPITVTELGIYGNASHYSASITLYIRSSTGTDLGNVSVTWGTGGQYYYGTLASPVVLSASTVYYIMTDDLNANDVYASATTTVTTTGVATVNDAAFGQPPSDETTGAGHAYGPLNFKYH